MTGKRYWRSQNICVHLIPKILLNTTTPYLVQAYFKRICWLNRQGNGLFTCRPVFTLDRYEFLEFSGCHPKLKHKHIRDTMRFGISNYQ